jgi:calcineurin-like phosphoesterase family protein
MVIYTPHRGTLADAMKEAKEFENIEEMKKFIVKKWNNDFSENDIVIGDKAIKDNRNGWEDSRYICTKRMGEENYIEKYGCPQCIGYCATIYKK